MNYFCLLSNPFLPLSSWQAMSMHSAAELVIGKNVIFICLNLFTLWQHHFCLSNCTVRKLILILCTPFSHYFMDFYCWNSSQLILWFAWSICLHKLFQLSDLFALRLLCLFSCSWEKKKKKKDGQSCIL